MLYSYWLGIIMEHVTTFNHLNWKYIRERTSSAIGDYFYKYRQNSEKL